ncbi:MAG: hypothetical protein JST27_02145 [Bacteroidetes bacterium]|nr:hypothetical protein [Bacteroidota bacterium]
MIKINTEHLLGKSNPELRKIIARKVDGLRGKRVYNRNSGIIIVFVSDSVKKSAYGGALYKDKVALIERLEKVLENMRFKNLKPRKEKDKVTVLGYMNFTDTVDVDGRKKIVMVAIQIRKGGKYYYNLDAVDKA